MLKLILCAISIIAFSPFSSARTISFDFEHNGHANKAVIKKGRSASRVEIYEDAKLLGKYGNLLVDKTSLFSNLVPLAGGGLAIEIDSEGSRKKFHIVVPIKKAGERLYVDCIYKTAYDSVAETRSVGASCKETDLGKFDISGAINDGGMIAYSDEPRWLRNILPATCINAVGLEYRASRIVRCSIDGVSDTKNQKIIIFDKQGESLGSFNGYELIPRPDDSGFALVADLQNQAIVFSGNLECLSQKKVVSNGPSGMAKIAGRFTINYALDTTGECLSGHYSYAGKSEDIELKGYKHDGVFYLLEIAARNVSSGLFLLNRLDDGARGVWVAVPPKEPFTVN